LKVLLGELDIKHHGHRPEDGSLFLGEFGALVTCCVLEPAIMLEQPFAHEVTRQGVQALESKANQDLAYQQYFPKPCLLGLIIWKNNYCWQWFAFGIQCTIISFLFYTSNDSLLVADILIVPPINFKGHAIHTLSWVCLLSKKGRGGDSQWLVPY
jgi:hypothetical protein